jgi:hypothetical protein
VKGFLVRQLRRQLLKLAVGAVIGAASLGFRFYLAAQEPAEGEPAQIASAEEPNRAPGKGKAGAEEEPEREVLAGQHVVRCELRRRIQYMTASDCATRGGHSLTPAP